MKRLLFILLILIAGCSNNPKYHYGDRVKFRLPDFYSTHCANEGRVVALKSNDDLIVQYSYHLDGIRCEREPGLHTYFDFWTKEADIQSILPE